MLAINLSRDMSTKSHLSFCLLCRAPALFHDTDGRIKVDCLVSHGGFQGESRCLFPSIVEIMLIYRTPRICHLQMIRHSFLYGYLEILTWSETCVAWTDARGLLFSDKYVVADVNSCSCMLIKALRETNSESHPTWLIGHKHLFDPFSCQQGDFRDISTYPFPLFFLLFLLNQSIAYLRRFQYSLFVTTFTSSCTLEILIKRKKSR